VSNLADIDGIFQNGVELTAAELASSRWTDSNVATGLSTSFRVYAGRTRRRHRMASTYHARRTHGAPQEGPLGREDVHTNSNSGVIGNILSKGS
jgi:hypothetical protein